MATTDEGVRYRDKITIVTGGAGCIGRACVEQFVKHGSKVVLVDIREDAGKEIEESVNKSGMIGQVLFVKCDITKEDDVQKMIAITIEKFGQIDCLINSAVYARLDQFALDKTTKEEFAYVLDVNILGAFIVSKYAIEHLRATKGNIINMGSMTATHGKAHAMSYTVSKTGLIGLTRSIAIDEAKNGVRVNCVSPAGVDSTLFHSAFATLPHGEKFKELYAKHMQFMGRLIQPEEVAKTCLYLATDATYSTGQNIYVSGGSELDYGFKHNMEWIYQSE